MTSDGAAPEGAALESADKSTYVASGAAGGTISLTTLAMGSASTSKRLRELGDFPLMAKPCCFLCLTMANWLGGLVVERVTTFLAWALVMVVVWMLVADLGSLRRYAWEVMELFGTRAGQWTTVPATAGI